MSRRRSQSHPDVGSGRTGLAVMEIQTLTLGHMRLLSAMAATCDVAIIGLGSTQKSGIAGHPFDFDQRRAMVEAVYGDRFRFIALQDIDARSDNGDWLRYVLSRISAAGLPAPTDCFSGSEIDARWYVDGFAPINAPKSSGAGIATYVRGHQQLHIIERSASGIPSGREIRFMIERRDDDWRPYVPAVLWNFVERQYPPHLRQAIYAGSRNDMERLDVPVGTLARLNGELWEYKADGRWRQARSQPDEKTAWANEHSEREKT